MEDMDGPAMAVRQQDRTQMSRDKAASAREGRGKGGKED